MKALDTILKATGTAAFTGALFALPLGLAMLWRAPTPMEEVQVVAAPMVAIAVLPLAITGEDEGPAQLDSDGDSAEGEGEGGAPSTERIQAVPRSERAVGAPRARRTAPAAPQQVVEKKKGRNTPCLPGTDAIDRVAPGTFAVERALVDSYAKAPGNLSKQGWAASHEGSDGKNDGFRIGGIQCGNDLHSAGLRNGDVVHAVNGKPVRNVPEALWVYATERKSDVVEIRLTRKGTERVLTYKIG